MLADFSNNYTVALFRPRMMLAVLDIIVENAAELTALDLSDNKLYALQSLSVLSVKLPNLKVLHIGRNRVSYSVSYCCVALQLRTYLLLICVVAF
jgi:Leucine-rich repeat (LRR) protein